MDSNDLIEVGNELVHLSQNRQIELLTRQLELLTKRAERFKKKCHSLMKKVDYLKDRNTYLSQEMNKKQDHINKLIEINDLLWKKHERIKSLAPLKYYEIEFVSVDSSGQESHVMKKTVSDYCPEMAIDTLNGQVMGFLFKTIRLVA